MKKRYFVSSLIVISITGAIFFQVFAADNDTSIKNNSCGHTEPDNGVTLNAGYNLYRVGKYDQALDVFERILETDPANYGALLNIGSIHHKKNDYQKAIKIFSTCIELAPDNPKAYFNRALVLMDLDRMDEALEMLTRACELDRFDSRTYYFIGDIYYLRENYQKALFNFTQSFALAPDNIKTSLRIADCHRELGNNEQELKIIRDLIAKQPSFYLYFRLGIIHSRMGSLNGEINAYKHAISFEPDNVDVRFNLGLAYYDTGSYELAKEQFEYVLSQKLSPDPVYYLARIALVEGNEFAAWRYYEMLQGLDAQRADELYELLK